jgi:hypothetical protein
MLRMCSTCCNIKNVLPQSEWVVHFIITKKYSHHYPEKALTDRPVSFQQCSIVIFALTTLLSGRQVDKPWEPCNIAVLFGYQRVLNTKAVSQCCHCS